MNEFIDRGPTKENGNHDKTRHVCPVTNSTASYDEGRFSSCPMCHLKPGDPKWKPIK